MWCEWFWAKECTAKERRAKEWRAKERKSKERREKSVIAKSERAKSKREKSKRATMRIPNPEIFQGIETSNWNNICSIACLKAKTEEELKKGIFQKHRVGHPFFSKERTFLRSFASYIKRMLRSLRSFMLFIKERCVLCVLYKRTRGSLNTFTFL